MHCLAHVPYSTTIFSLTLIKLGDSWAVEPLRQCQTVASLAVMTNLMHPAKFSVAQMHPAVILLCMGMSLVPLIPHMTSQICVHSWDSVQSA